MNAVGYTFCSAPACDPIVCVYVRVCVCVRVGGGGGGVVPDHDGEFPIRHLLLALHLPCLAHSNTTCEVVECHL